MAADAVARKAIKSLGRTRLGIPGFANKFLYVSGKYLQPRVLSTLSFGKVFARVLRFKLAANQSEASTV